jgi:hypothetical protein
MVGGAGERGDGGVRSAVGDNGRLVVYGWLMDARTAGSAPVLASQYNEAASEEMARTVAHRFADDIIYRLGGGSTASPKPRFIS